MRPLHTTSLIDSFFVFRFGRTTDRAHPRVRQLLEWNAIPVLYRVVHVTAYLRVATFGVI